jgi:hypothetical protein
MMVHRILRAGILIGLVTSLAACGGFGRVGEMFSRPAAQPVDEPLERIGTDRRTSTIWDLFENRDPPNVTVEVNRYLWNASLEVLDFLPVQTVDPFSGVIVTGFGTPPGGGQAYRAAVLINDPALDARSLKVAIMTRSGPASPATIRAVEDAILTRARQLRIRDSRL